MVFTLSTIVPGWAANGTGVYASERLTAVRPETPVSFTVVTDEMLPIPL